MGVVIRLVRGASRLTRPRERFCEQCVRLLAARYLKSGSPSRSSFSRRALTGMPRSRFMLGPVVRYEGAMRVFNKNLGSVGRLYSRNEHLADTVIHVAGVLFAINGAAWLLFHVARVSVIASVSVYCAGLFAMLTASALYNLAPHGNARDWLA